MKKLLSLMLALLLCAVLLPLGAKATEPTDPFEDLWGLGTETYPWRIRSMADWNTFKSGLEAGANTSGKYFKLTVDISISDPITDANHPFMGHFDGNDHTITVSFSGNEDYIAPFRYVSGASFEHLKVAGTITSSGSCASGLVGAALGDCTISDCLVSCTIYANGGGQHAGFAAMCSGGAVRVYGSVFTGAVISAAGTQASACAGFLGWAGESVSSCVYDGTMTNCSEASTFIRTKNAAGNCYYLNAVGVDRIKGKKGWTITAGEGVDIDFGEPVAVYSTSGITAYAPGLVYNGVFYAGENDTLNLGLSVTEPDHKRFLGWNDVEGLTVSADNSAVLHMPAADVAITANYEDIVYVDLSLTPENGGQVFGAGVYRRGAVVNVIARPWEGYRIDHWVKSTGTVIDAPGFNLVANGDSSFQAVFVEDPTNVNSCVLELPELFSPAANSQISALSVPVTALNMNSYHFGHLPVKLVLSFTADHNGVLTKPYFPSKSIQFGIDDAQNASGLPLQVEMEFSSVGSQDLYVLVPASAWEEADPGTYTGTISYSAVWVYDDGSVSEPIETGAIPVSVTVPGTPEAWEVEFTLGFFDGYLETPAKQLVANGGTVSDPGEYKVNGPDSRFYFFTGWYTDPDCTEIYDFNAPVTDDLKLYAGYEIGGVEANPYGNILFVLGITEREWAMYLETGDDRWQRSGSTYIGNFDLIDGADYDPETHTLTLENYSGSLISIYGSQRVEIQDGEDDGYPFIDENGKPYYEHITINVKGENHIYAPSSRSGTALSFLNITFTGDGTINYDYLGDYTANWTGFWSDRGLIVGPHRNYYDRNNKPDPIQIIWDGPTVNIFNMNVGINQCIYNFGHDIYDIGVEFTLLNGAVNVEITPQDTDTWPGGYGIPFDGTSFNLAGGSLHVRYTLSEEVLNYYETKLIGGFVSPDGNCFPVLDGFTEFDDYYHMAKEPIISPNCDLQITVDEELAEHGVSAIPFVPEPYNVCPLDPEKMPYGSGAIYLERAIGDPIDDINEIEGLSFNYEDYYDLGAHNHKLTMNNYSGYGFVLASRIYDHPTLEIELIGENTIYCNGAGGLGFDDLNVIFTGTGTLHVIGMDTGLRGTFEDGEEYVDFTARSYSGIFRMRNAAGGNTYVERGDVRITVDGPHLIIHGAYMETPIATIDDVRILSGSLAADACPCPVGPARYMVCYQSVIWPSGYVHDYPTIQAQGGAMIVNVQASPRGYDVFYAFLKNGVEYYGIQMRAHNGVDFAPDTLLLVGEERVLRYGVALYIKDENGEYWPEQYTGTLRKIQTAEVENGRALVCVEGGKAIVTPEPDPGMELVGLSYVADGGEPVEIPLGPEGCVFEYPMAQVVTITAVFEPMDGYFLIGPDWTVESIDWTRELAPNPNAAGEYLLRTELAEDEQLKAVHVTAGVIDAWYPEGLGNEYTVDAAHSGDVIVYFRPQYQADWAAFGGHLWITAPPTEPVETSELRIFSSISVGSDMVVTWTARKTDVQDYEKFWIEVVKHAPDGDLVYTYGAEQPEALEEGNTTWFADFKHVFAKEMGVEIEARLCAQDATGQIYRSPAKTTNIRDYLGGRLTATNNTVAQRVLAADMLNYGAAAQRFMNYDVEHLVNEELTAEQLAKLDQYETKTLPAVNKTNSNYRPEGQSNVLFNSVSLDNEVILNLTVRANEGDTVKILMRDHDTGVLVETLDAAWNGSNFEAEYKGIGADKMRVAYDFTAQINNVETGNTRTWSVEGYVGEIRAGSLPLKTAMANALLTYGDSAAAYFAAQ